WSSRSPTRRTTRASRSSGIRRGKTSGGSSRPGGRFHEGFPVDDPVARDRRRPRGRRDRRRHRVHHARRPDLLVPDLDHRRRRHLGLRIHRRRLPRDVRVPPHPLRERLHPVRAGDAADAPGDSGSLRAPRRDCRAPRSALGEPEERALGEALGAPAPAGAVDALARAVVVPVGLALRDRGAHLRQLLENEAPISQRRASATKPWARLWFTTPVSETAAVAITAAAIAKPRITRSDRSFSASVTSVSARYRKYTAARSQISAIAPSVYDT